MYAACDDDGKEGNKKSSIGFSASEPRGILIKKTYAGVIVHHLVGKFITCLGNAFSGRVKPINFCKERPSSVLLKVGSIINYL